MKYVIYPPLYSHKSAGIRVLYRLYHELKNRSVDVSISIFGQDIEDKNITVIYPEIISGNPLKAKKVVRYVLYYPGANGGDEVYNDNELVFYYSDLYKDSISNEVQGKLHIPVVEFGIFYDRELERTKVSSWVGKGEGAAVGTEVTGRYPDTREDVAILFSESKYFLCHDPATMLVQEAIMCGCPVVLTSGYDEYIKNEYGLSGVCEDVEHLDEARATMHRVCSKMIRLEFDMSVQIEHLLEVTK